MIYIPATFKVRGGGGGCFLGETSQLDMLLCKDVLMIQITIVDTIWLNKCSTLLLLLLLLLLHT